jgi:hypothetical protein
MYSNLMTNYIQCAILTIFNEYWAFYRAYINYAIFIIFNINTIKDCLEFYSRIFVICYFIESFYIILLFDNFLIIKIGNPINSISYILFLFFLLIFFRFLVICVRLLTWLWCSNFFLKCKFLPRLCLFF